MAKFSLVSRDEPVRSVAIALLVFVIGCGAEKPQPERASGSALERAPTGKASPVGGEGEEWQKAAFAFVQTELSPAILFHCAGKEINFFTHLADHDLGGPAHLACATQAGIKSYNAGEVIDPSGLEECWLLVWFSGANGWTNRDIPWALYLQHKPRGLRLNEAGLHLRFAMSAGDIVLLPLYGYDKPPQQDSRAPSSPQPSPPVGERESAPTKKIKTSGWAKNLPREPLMRVRYWASALREFPIYCENGFSVDRAKDTLTIRQRFQWHSINDDWKTEHLKLAPISPPLAQAGLDKRVAVTFSKPMLNHDLFTPYGPYAGIEGVDSYEAIFHGIQTVNETEALDLCQWGSAAKPNRYLVPSIHFRGEDNKPIWPEITWPKNERTPGGHRWSFGHVQPGTNAAPASVKVISLNWNSQAVVYTLRNAK